MDEVSRQLGKMPVVVVMFHCHAYMRLCVNTYVVLTVMPYTVLGQPHLLGLSAALAITGLDFLASVGDTVSCLFLAGVCSAFYSSGLLLTTCLLFREIWIIANPQEEKCLLLLVDCPGTNMLRTS